MTPTRRKSEGAEQSATIGNLSASKSPRRDDLVVKSSQEKTSLMSPIYSHDAEIFSHLASPSPAGPRARSVMNRVGKMSSFGSKRMDFKFGQKLASTAMAELEDKKGACVKPKISINDEQSSDEMVFTSLRRAAGNDLLK